MFKIDLFVMFNLQKIQNIKPSIYIRQQMHCLKAKKLKF